MDDMNKEISQPKADSTQPNQELVPELGSDTVQQTLNKYRLDGVLVVLCALLFAFMGNSILNNAQDYSPIPQQVFLNIYNQPVGVQDLTQDTTHNPEYRTGSRGEAAADYLSHAMLSSFSYDKDDLVSGNVLRNFYKWFSVVEAENVYQNIFVNLSQQKIVMAQDAIVRSRLVGDWVYKGKAIWPYHRSVVERTIPALTYKFEGRIIVTAYGESDYPTVYAVTAMVQRTMLQDKMAGYQIVQLEMR